MRENEHEKYKEMREQKGKKNAEQMLAEMEKKVLEVSGGVRKPMRPEDEKRYEKMRKDFEKIDAQRSKTAELKAKKEQMLREQAAFVPPALPGSY